MKKLFICCSSFLFALCISAQNTAVKKTTVKTNPTNNFCNTFKKILDNRHNDFKELYTWGFTHTITDVNNYAVPALHGRYSSQGYNSKLKVPGAKANFISYETIQGKEYKTYYAYWGNYKTRFPADKKNDELKKLLMACLGDYEAIKVPGEKVEKDKYHMLVNTKYEFRNKNPEKRNEPKIYLLYERDPDYDDENVIFLIIEGNSFMNLRIENENKLDPSTVKDSLLWDFIFDFPFLDLEKTKLSNQFNEQLSSIVADYANNFAIIKGEMKSTGSKGNYYSKVELQGADSVYLIQNWTTRRLDFIAVYPKYSSKEEAREKFNELVAQIDKCKFPCCTFAKTDVSEHSSGASQSWLPFDLFRKMEPAYKDILLEVEIFQVPEKDEKSEKLAFIWVWSLVLRVTKL